MAKITVGIIRSFGLGANVCGELGLGFSGSLSTPTLLNGEYCCIIPSKNSYFTAYIDKNMNLFMSGDNSLGQFGDGTIIKRCNPVQIPGLYLGAGIAQNSSYFLKTDNTLWATGNNGTSQLGFAGTSRSSPVQIPGSWCCVVGGGSQYAGGILTNGGLRTFGFNNYGQLGNNTTVSCSYATVPGAWIGLSAGAFTMYGIKADCTLWAWGNGNAGGLGINSTTPRSSPVQIPGIWTNVSAGVSGGGTSVAAVRGDGTTWVWGIGTTGELGIGSTANISSPILLPGNWQCVLLNNSSFGIKEDGTLFVWGSCVNNSLINEYKSSPTQISGEYWSLDGITNGILDFYLKQSFCVEYNKNTNQGVWDINEVYDQKKTDKWSDFIPTIDD